MSLLKQEKSPRSVIAATVGSRTEESGGSVKTKVWRSRGDGIQPGGCVLFDLNSGHDREPTMIAQCPSWTRLGRPQCEVCRSRQVVRRQGVCYPTFCLVDPRFRRQIHGSPLGKTFPEITHRLAGQVKSLIMGAVRFRMSARWHKGRAEPERTWKVTQGSDECSIRDKK